MIRMGKAEGIRGFIFMAYLLDLFHSAVLATPLYCCFKHPKWYVKPKTGIVYALQITLILSDCIPIKGRKRIPYLVIASLLSLLPWPILGLNSTLRSSQWHLTLVLTVQNLGSAMVNVVVDAMVAEGYVFVYI
ncbi:hypothetical protein NC652_004314 [Populus alba x Populus x berolinensis]|nr:hypothetical protein NC652_004314 [Populus alba x Populus x berolinensis]